MTKIFEIVYYNIEDIDKEKDFIKNMEELNNKILKKVKWFISRKMLKDENGLFCDIILWDNIYNAKKALKILMNYTIAHKVFSYIKNDSVQINYFEILSWSHENLEFDAWAVEIGTVKLKDNNKLNEVVNSWKEVRTNFLEKQNGFIAQFMIKKDDGLYGEIVFNKNDINETKEICEWYFTDETAKKYISFFDPNTTKLKYWTILK